MDLFQLFVIVDQPAAMPADAQSATGVVVFHVAVVGARVRVKMNLNMHRPERPERERERDKETERGSGRQAMSNLPTAIGNATLTWVLGRDR